MLQQHATILSNNTAGEHTYVIRLESAYFAKEARPGQFFHVRVTNSLDPLLRRPLSLHRRYPDSNAVELLYKLQGRGTHLLSQRKPGETLDVLGPLGNGFPEPKGTTYLAAGGMGVAPLPALVDDLCPESFRENVTVFVGARTASALLCVDEFKNLGVAVETATEDGSSGYHGLVSDLIASRALPDCIFCCGPNGMIKALVRYALEKHIACYVSVEERMACGVGMCRACAIRTTEDGVDSYSRVCKDGPVFSSDQLSSWACSSEQNTIHQCPPERGIPANA